jgi:hypothetical protein
MPFSKSKTNPLLGYKKDKMKMIFKIPYVILMLLCVARTAQSTKYTLIGYYVDTNTFGSTCADDKPFFNYGKSNIRILEHDVCLQAGQTDKSSKAVYSNSGSEKVTLSRYDSKDCSGAATSTEEYTSTCTYDNWKFSGTDAGIPLQTCNNCNVNVKVLAFNLDTPTSAAAAKVAFKTYDDKDCKVESLNDKGKQLSEGFTSSRVGKCEAEDGAFGANVYKVVETSSGCMGFSQYSDSICYSTDKYSVFTSDGSCSQIGNNKNTQAWGRGWITGGTGDSSQCSSACKDTAGWCLTDNFCNNDGKCVVNNCRNQQKDKCSDSITKNWLCNATKTGSGCPPRFECKITSSETVTKCIPKPEPPTKPPTDNDDPVASATGLYCFGGTLFTILALLWTM